MKNSLFNYTTALPTKIRFATKTLSLCALLLVALQSCTYDVLEPSFALEPNAAAQAFFAQEIQPIFTKKCNSCHYYHNSPATAYDSFDKTFSSINEIRERTSTQISALVMPPSDFGILTEDEQAKLAEFVELLTEESSSTLATEQASQGEAEASLAIGFEAFKFPEFSERKGVKGTFTKYDIQLLNKSADIYERLKGASIQIQGKSVDIGGSEMKTTNVRDHFFAMLMPNITGKVLSINAKEAVLEINLNDIKQNVRFEIRTNEAEQSMTFKGKIEDLNVFQTSTAFAALDAVCGQFHDGYVWPDVNLEVVINNYEAL